MSARTATAEWKGSLKEGTGKMAVGSGAFEGTFSFDTRMGDEPGTTPEELLGASLAGCFTMALNATLEKAGKPATSVNSEAKVYLGKDDAGFVIKHIDLETTALVDGIEDEEFQQIAADVKKGCPISRALASTTINLTANLAKS